MGKGILIFVILGCIAGAIAYVDAAPFTHAKENIVNWMGSISQGAGDSVPSSTGLNLSHDYFKTYPAYEQDLGGGLKLYSKIPIAPPIKVWNYEIKTSSSVNYAVKIKQSTEGVTMIGFWVIERDKWAFRNDVLFLPYDAFGNIGVSRAPTYEIR